MTPDRRAIIEVRWAKAPIRKVVIEPGGKLRIGQSERADLAVPADRAMSAIHCEIRWDGATCRVVSRSAQSPTFVDGQQVEQGQLQNGGWIRAGSTVFSVYFEGATPPRATSGLKGDGTDPLTPAQAEALASLQAEPLPLLAVLDAARTLRILEVMRESVEAYRSLYEGIKGDALAMVAPYLVRVPRESRLLRQLVQEGWGHGWGLYLTSRRPFDEVRTQLRRLLMVRNDQTGRAMYFRFYDPQMLRLFLPTCGTRQKEQPFGEIEAFVVEGRRGEVLRLTEREGPGALEGKRTHDRS
jgi:hypothetical protein